MSNQDWEDGYENGYKIGLKEGLDTTWHKVNKDGYVTEPVKELTDEEIMKTCIKHGIYDCISDSYIKDDGTNSLDEDLIRFARAILRKAQERC